MLKKKIKYFFPFLVFLASCVPCPPEVIQVMQDHKIVCKETCQELISDIKKALPNYKEEDRVKLENLINRLEYMISSSDALNKYIVENTYDQEIIIKLIRLRQKLKQGEL